MHPLFAERRDFAAVAAIDDADLCVAVDLLHEPHAACAQDAALAVEHQRRTEVDVPLDAFAVEHASREIHPALGRTEGVGEILQRALAAFVADRTVERMVDEQELEHARTGGGGLRIPGAHDHALGADGRARRLQLRHLFDLDDAHAAGPVDADAGVVAVVRDGDAGLDGRL
jgi:hypothetical protein